jgi:penicillin G amidase
MADEDKVVFHFPGGVSERWFDPRNKNFLDAYLSGEKKYLWFSDTAIDENADSRLTLRP